MAGRKRINASKQTSQRKRSRPNAGATSTASRQRKVNDTTSDEPESQNTPSVVDGGTDESGTDLEDVRVALGELQNAMAREEKLDTFDADIETKIRQDERRLVKLIREKEKKRQVEDEGFQSHFASLITAALGIDSSPSAENAVAEEDEADKGVAQSHLTSLKERHPLYVKSQLLLENSNALIASMNVLTEYTSNIALPLPPAQEWEEDQAEMRRLIQAGRQITEGKIEELISAERAYTKKGRGIGVGGSRRWNIGINYKRKRVENDENLQTMLSLGHEDDESHDGEEDQNLLGWGFVAHQIEKGMHAFFKVLD